MVLFRDSWDIFFYFGASYTTSTFHNDEVSAGSLQAPEYAFSRSLSDQRSCGMDGRMDQREEMLALLVERCGVL